MAIGLNHDTQIAKPGEEVFLQVGSIFSNARSTAPSGYLLCDGSTISRTDFSRLFSAIGATYGSGDGNTTFNIPDLRGVTARGTGTSVGYTSNSTITLGTKTDDAIQGHKHTVDSHNHGGGVHNHNIPVKTGGFDSGMWHWYSAPGGSDSAPNTVWGSDYSIAIIDYAFPNTGDATTMNNGSPRTQSETRVKSLGINFFIKY
jgi:hypothetical protein